MEKVQNLTDQQKQLNSLFDQIKNKSDKTINYFLSGFFLMGLLLAPFYDTWAIGISVGGISLLAYYSAKLLAKKSDLYQYVLSIVFGVFMAQYIYQMHGLFEMHFIAFIGSAMLITYQNWKLQIPLAAVVVVHHAILGYLQYSGLNQVYFTQLDYTELPTFIIHAFFASLIFFVCGLWSYHFKNYSKKHIEQSFEIGRLRIIESQKEELTKANMELDKFVYSVSHDLKAPLLSMHGVISMTEEETTEELTQIRMQLVGKSIAKLNSFIGDILNYSRNACTEVKHEPIDFKDMLQDITNNLQYMNGSFKPVAIKFNIEETGIFNTDKSRLSIVLNNLVSNSIRYHNPNAEKPFVNICVKSNNDTAQIEIEDNGVGISKEFHIKIFDMFYRVSENSNGSGLGLYIVKETVEKLNGNIQIESKIGQGTKFNISLPNLLYQ